MFILVKRNPEFSWLALSGKYFGQVHPPKNFGGVHSDLLNMGNKTSWKKFKQWTWNPQIKIFIFCRIEILFQENPSLSKYGLY